MSAQWIGGVHAVEQALNEQIVQSIQVQKDKRSKNVLKLIERAQSENLPIEFVEGYEIDLLLPAVKHQGIAAYCQLETASSDWKKIIAGKENPLILILDGIQDPHNLGACLRSALAASVDVVLLPNSRSAPINPTVHKVSCGASEILPITITSNLKREIDAMKKMGIWIVGGAGEGEKTIYETDFKQPIAIIVGNEGEGIRYGLKQSCDYLVRIPISEKMESLNVSVASAIMLFEAQRQRNFS